MASQDNKREAEIVIVPSVLGYELNSEQNVIANYLIPSVFGCLLYILHFACDFTVAYRHFREEHGVWGALTVFFMYLPILGCYLLTISAWELWPEFDGCGCTNIKWAIMKTLQHTFFPAWSMWRYAERIFWSIEGIRAADEEEKEEAVKILDSPRTIELYYFLQAYLQAVPQILFQLHILMRYADKMEPETVHVQVISFVMSVAQMAKTTTVFQRFKSQKVAGKSYPWFKPYKMHYDCTDAPLIRRATIVYRCSPSVIRNSPAQSVPPGTPSQSIVRDSQGYTVIRDSQEQPITLRQQEGNLDPQASRGLERRRSSDFYEQPTDSYLEHLAQENAAEFGRETSVVDGPKRLVLRDDIDEPDFFNPKRLIEIKALPNDDSIGKLIAFFWWFCFLLARMLAISTFGYFYSTEVIWILCSHFVLVVALLLYDVRADEVRRAKAIFFVFIGFVYLFCLIEFKIQFKKAWFIYNLFFSLMFIENFTMVFIWWFRDTEDIFNDWWYRYIFYMIVGCSILSMFSMLMYIKVLRPQKVVIDVAEK